MKERYLHEVFIRTNTQSRTQKNVKSGMSPIIIAQRAKILLLKDDGKSGESIAEELGINRHTIDLWNKKYRQRKPENSIMELISVSEGRGRKKEITREAKTWLISVACQKTTDFGYAAETWTTPALTKYIRQHVEEAEYGRLSTISESGVFDILNKSNIKPFRIRYYCERWDPDFDAKMHNVLLVYKQVCLQFDNDGNLLPFKGDKATHVLSYDEKPGIQVVANKFDDLMPNENNGVIMRDYEHKRLGTIPLLAGIDLQTGEEIPLVSDTHTITLYF